MVVLTLAVLTMVRVAMSVVVPQRGSVPPAGQLLPVAAEVTVEVRIPLPVSGLFTVTV